MSVSSVSGNPQALVSQFMNGLGKVAETPQAKAAGELLGQLLDSAFEGPPSPLSSQQMNQRFASPLQQFAGQLQALGVNAGTVGEVLNSLNKLLKQKGERGLRRFKGTKGAPESLTKAADLMSSLLRAAEDARQSHRSFNG